MASAMSRLLISFLPIVGGLVVLSGLLILVGAVSMTKFQRIYEAAILKTLGATRDQIGRTALSLYGFV